MPRKKNLKKLSEIQLSAVQTSVIIIAILILFFVIVELLIYIDDPPGKTKNAIIDYSSPEYINDVDVEIAVDEILALFKSFRGCTLTKLWYDEEETLRVLDDRHQRYDTEKVKYTNKNFMVFLSEFDTSSGSNVGCFSPNATYKHWSWTLFKEDENSEWIIIGYGLG